MWVQENISELVAVMCTICKKESQSNLVLNDTDTSGSYPQTMLLVFPLQPSLAPEKAASQLYTHLYLFPINRNEG